MSAFLQIGAVIFAGGAGLCLSQVYLRSAAAKGRARMALSRLGLMGAGGSASAKQQRWSAKVVGLSERFSRQAAAHAFDVAPGAKALLGRSTRKWLRAHEALAKHDNVTERGLIACRFRLGGVGALALAILAYALSFPLVAVVALAVFGFVLGARLPFRAACEEAALRRQALERELPEMLSLVTLGLQSGLSFDRSFALYPRHFDTEFSKSCRLALGQWEMALATREEALTALARAYESPLFSQAVTAMIRSLKFGTSLTESLETLSQETRAQYRAQREQDVARAPVKMLVPTCSLILPALIILIMGPVLLEMMGGF